MTKDKENQFSKQEELQLFLDEYCRTQPLFIKAIKRKLDAGEELLVLKHQYDLSIAEVEQILDLYEVELKGKIHE